MLAGSVPPERQLDDSFRNLGANSEAKKKENDKKKIFDSLILYPIFSVFRFPSLARSRQLPQPTRSFFFFKEFVCKRNKYSSIAAPQKVMDLPTTQKPSPDNEKCACTCVRV